MRVPRSCVAMRVLAAAATLWIPAFAGAPLAAQEPSASPSLTTLEEQLEQVFAAALAISDDEAAEPMHVLQAWGTVMMSATVLEARRAQELGRASDAEQVQDALLERWRELRPAAAGPDLMRLLQIQDQEARAPGLLELVESHPDDPLVLSQVGTTLRSLGQAARVTELLEAHAERHPTSGSAWRLLAEHYGSQQNQTLEISALVRWAEAKPDDPALIDRWLGAGLDRLEPEASARLLERFFDRPRDDPRALETCARLARVEDSPHRSAARRCVARVAGSSREDDDGARARERAIGVLAELAAAEGDWTSLLDSLEALEPEARGRALVASAYRIGAPSHCSQRIELLRAALPGAPAEGSLHSSIATAARACDQRPAARSLFLDLLESAPSDRVARVLGAWASRVNGVLRGDVPAGAAAVLEARLEREPRSGDLYRALDSVYELAGEPDRRLELLQRWMENAPDSMGSREVTALAWELAARGETGEAVGLLERRLGRSFSQEEAELLWQIYAEPAVPDDEEWPDEAAWREGLERADRWAGELIAGGEPSRAAFGHVLAARGAIFRDDLAAAERHYLEALGTIEHPRDEWVTEMLGALSDSASAERIAEIALLACEQTAMTQRHRGRGACATTLLSRSGNVEAVAEITALVGELPDDEDSLLSLAFSAQQADPELAERAWRRLLELDPMDATVWGNFAGFLAKHGRAEEIEALLAQARERFGRVPSGLLQTVGRARIASNQPEGAIEILEEARAALPAGADPAWVDADLREAYAAIGGRERMAAARASAPPAPPASLRPLDHEETAALEVSLAEADARTLLTVAEELRTGTKGRYDPQAARRLLERAVATGDALASYRLAIDRRSGAHGIAPATLAAVESMARQGDSYARLLVGTGALLGVGRERDLAAARHWLELASLPQDRRQGEPWAHHNLAYMVERGEGFEEADSDAAIEGYRRAGDLGNVASLYDFARLTLRHHDVALCREGLARLERAATAGHSAAAAYLGKVLFYGPGGTGGCVTLEPARARPWLEAALEAEEPGASYDLGLLLLLSGGAADVTRGLELLEEAAGEPTALAIETLHLVRATGAFAPRDPERARALRAEAVRFGSDGITYLRREAAYPPGRRLLEEGTARLESLVAAGDASARSLLAAILLQGPYELRDPERGVRLARQAAAVGDGWGARLLAGALEEGTGTEADPREALRLTRAAAEAGDPFAMFDLSVELMSGERLEPDLEAGIGWLTRAAERGHWQAIGELARLYAEGRPGIARRPELATRWKRRRAELGDDEARGWLLAHGHEPP
ncbi:MAG TPA: hypothetical protein VMT85_02790 [Thermoanaerobaculia bacterium]|nr:hypothetical protein [Thermoanaerobaculia bacterium]